jgi:hypothetical protein
LKKIVEWLSPFVLLNFFSKETTMQRILRIAALLAVLGLPVLLLTQENTPDEDPAPFIPSLDEVVIRSDTPAWDNTIEVRDFLAAADQNTTATAITARLNAGAMYYHSKKDIFGVDNADGRTYRRGRPLGISPHPYIWQSFRSNYVRPGRRFRILGGNINEFKAGISYMLVLTHEMQHYADYAANRLTSSENPTYYSNYLQMMQIFRNYVLPNYIRLEETDPQNAALWKQRVVAYLQILSQEMRTYLVEDYGELGTFPPLLTHDRSVGNLTRQQTVEYMNLLTCAIERGTRWSEIWQAFDRKVAFQYPLILGSSSLLLRSPEVGRLSHQMPVGYAGPRRIHTLYEFDVATEDRLILNKTAGEIHIAFALHNVISGQALELANAVHHIYSWSSTGTYTFARPGKRYLVVYEVGENANPVQFGFQLIRVCRDEEGNETRHNVQPYALGLPENAHLGYHPIAEYVPSLLFSENSMGTTDGFDRQEALEFEAQEGDYLRMTVPQVDNRVVRLFRVEDASSDELPRLHLVAFLYAYHPSADYRVEQTGKYLLVVFRDSSIETNQRLDLNLQFSRNGQTGPDTIQIRTLTQEDYARYGFHPPSLDRITVSFRENSPVGYFSAYRQQMMLDLDTRRGDRIRLLDMASNEGRTLEVVKVVAGNLVFVGRIYPWHDNTQFQAEDDARHLLIVSNAQDFTFRRDTFLQMRRWRHSRGGPQEARLRWLATEEQAAFGYFPIRVLDVRGTLNHDSPTGFVSRNRHFQNYEFRVAANVRMHWVSEQPPINRRFILSRVDEPLFNQGQPCLHPVLRTFRWSNSFTKDLTPGRYVLTLEADEAGTTGEVPFRISFSQNGVSPAAIDLVPMANADMLDPRFRLVAGE